MKKETYAKKLAALLGLEEIKEEHDKEQAVRKGNLHEVPESKIQTVREAQGITYFLQAPFLFQYKVCPHCGADFLVSRMYVAYCSYTCIEKSLEEMGIKWSRAGKIDSMIEEVYDKQEPIWIRNLDQLQSALQRLIDYRATESQSLSTTSAPGLTSSS